MPRFVPARLLGLCLVASFGGTCLLLGASQAWAIVAATALAGPGLAPIFPLAVASYSETAKADKSAGFIFSAGGLGGASIAALVGTVSESASGLRFAMAIPPVLILLMLFLWKTSVAGRRTD